MLHKHKFVSFDIRIGSSTTNLIESAKQDFHTKSAELAFPDCAPLDRSGVSVSTPISQTDYHYSPELFERSITATSRELIDPTIDPSHAVILVDFTSNVFLAIRDPFLIAVFDQCIKLSQNNACHNFVILLRELPGASSASVHLLIGYLTDQAKGRFRVCLIANSGKSMMIQSRHKAGAEVEALPSAGIDSETREQFIVESELVSYSDLVQEQQETPEKRLSNRCIRRLGHFKRALTVGSSASGSLAPTCRRYSYLLLESERELYSLIQQWWSTHAGDSRIVLYDSRNNNWLRNPICAFAERKGLICRRLVDVLTLPDVADDLKQHGTAVLALDVVSSGSTLLGHVKALNECGIQVSDRILTCINRGGTELTTVSTTDRRTLHVHGLLSREPDPVGEKCSQCLLGLPHTHDELEDFIQMRSYDFLQIADECGLEAEPPKEVPKFGGAAFPTVPHFDKVLEKYGDWITYKFMIAISRPAENRPENWFILHPDQANATTIADRLSAFYEKRISTIGLGEDVIIASKKLADGDTSQRAVIEQSLVGQTLARITGHSALVVDIFNGSGSTYRAMSAILRHYKLNHFAYCVVVDYDPVPLTPIQGRKISLYDWKFPRATADFINKC